MVINIINSFVFFQVFLQKSGNSDNLLGFNYNCLYITGVIRSIGVFLKILCYKEFFYYIFKNIL